MSRQAQLLAIWALCSFIAAFAALQFTPSAYETQTDTWVPVSNDSFYHGRRIIDAADSGELRQFDDRMHVPEGSWINWPWAYDWTMAKALQGWRLINPDGDPMAFLGHVPVYWVFVNAALLLGICVLLGLAIPWTALVMLGYALSPLTMVLHGVGIIDHHFIEHTFVLATLFTGLKWFQRPDKSLAAVLLGVTLGLAPAFHTGLFILQAPVLVTLGILWLRGNSPPKEALLALASALILTTLLALAPSEPFRQGQFQFAVLSWFHLYIAAVSTLLIAGFARFRFTLGSLTGLLILTIALLIPIWGDTIGGAAFLTGKITLLDKISEAMSPFRLAQQPGHSAYEMIAYYSVFGLLAPLLILLYLWRGWQSRDDISLYFAVMTVFGLTLLFTQFRLHYFGSFAVLLGWAVLLNEKFTFAQRKPMQTTLVGMLIVVLGFYPGIDEKINSRYALGLDPAYQDLFGLFGPLVDSCATDPGVVFADNNFGHYIRYHTDCSVIANNFLMTPLHEEKIREMQALMEFSPEEFLEAAPADVRYVFARLVKFYGTRDDGDYAMTSTQYLMNNNERLFFELNARADLPERFQVIGELPLDETRGLVRARIFKILPKAEE